VPWVRHAVGGWRSFKKDEWLGTLADGQRLFVNLPLPPKFNGAGFERGKLDVAFYGAKHNAIGVRGGIELQAIQ
jgi:hypothetical protein